jgi:putative membrane protein
MKSRLLIAGAVFLLAAGSSTVQAWQNEPVTSQGVTGAVRGLERQFIMKAAQGGMYEVEAAKLALSNASSSEVKQFAERLVADHTKANQQLMQIAAQKGVSVPDSMGQKHESKLNRLRKLQAEEFDRAYMSEMVKDHAKDVQEFRTASQRATDQDVKTFASTTLATLEAHLEQARSIAGNVGAHTGHEHGKDKGHDK